MSDNVQDKTLIDYATEGVKKTFIDCQKKKFSSLFCKGNVVEIERLLNSKVSVDQHDEV